MEKKMTHVSSDHKYLNGMLLRKELYNILRERVIEYIVEKKRYRDKDYSAKKLATDIGTNTRYVSAVIKTAFDVNYSTYVNKYRIEEACSLLTDRRYKDLTVDEIADMVGFSNRQSFYTAFEKFEEMTPRRYRVLYMQLPADIDMPKKKGRKLGSKNKSKEPDIDV